MKTENKIIAWLFYISGCILLFAVFLSIYRILFHGPAALNVCCVLVIELLCFLTASVLLADTKPADIHLCFFILYLFTGALVLICSPDFLYYTERFYVITIGLIGFLSGLNALFFFCFNAGEK